MKPHVILNCAMSLDGFIGKSAKRVKFSNKLDKQRVHKLRAKVDGIMVGINTVLVDNPHLTVRHARGKNPVRIIVDSKARIPLNAKVLDNDARTIVAVSRKARKERVKKIAQKAEVIVSGSSRINLKQLLEKLHARKIRSVLLEGGGTLIKSMIDENLVDELYLTIAPVLLGSGVRWIEKNLGSKRDLKYSDCNVLNNQVVLHYKLK